MPSRTPVRPSASRCARPLAAALVGALLALTTACGGDSAAAPSDAERNRTVASDHQKAPVEVPAEPKRVVTLGWATGPLLEIEDSPVVGVADNDVAEYGPDSRDRFTSLPKVGMRTEINAEKVAELKPDLILSGIPVAANMNYEQLAEIAPIVVAAPAAPADWKKTTERFWDAAGLADEGAELAGKYDARAAEVKKEVEDSAAADLVFGVASDGRESGVKKADWMLEYQDSWSTTVLGDAGVEFLPRKGESKGAGPGAEWFGAHSYEELDELNGVDAVIVPAEEDGKPTPGSAKLMDQAPWAETTPVEKDRVLLLPWSQASSYRTGLLLFDAFEEKLRAEL